MSHPSGEAFTRSEHAAAGGPSLLRDGRRVLDLTDALGVYATKLLADFGYEVIRLDRVPVRREPLDADGSISWWDAFFNQNKRRVSFDESRDEDRELFWDVWSECDILVWSSLEGPRDPSWSFVKDLQESDDKIVAIVTPFGTDSPYSNWSGSDLVNMALGGFLSLSGYEEMPVVPFGEQSFVATGLHAALAISVATWHLNCSGEGQTLEIIAQEAVAHALENAVQFVNLEGKVRGRTGESFSEAGSGIFACRDGYVYLMTFLQGSPLRWGEFVQWLDDEGADRSEDFHDVRWNDPGWRKTQAAIEQFKEVFEGFASSYRKVDLYIQGQHRGVNIAPLNTLEDVVQNPQLRSRQFFEDVQVSDGDRTQSFMRPPFRTDQFSPRHDYRSLDDEDPQR